MSPTVTWTPEEGVAQLVSILGQEHAHLRENIVVAVPRDLEQMAAVLRFAHENGLAVTPTGGGTKLDWGNPVDPAIQLSLERMHRLHEHAWQDMTCTVEAGLPWKAMQAELARHGQMVALDPLWPDRATVGGIVATNDSGALRLKYGGLRDLIIGMTIVLADGTIARTGGKVVKNVAGYDLHKLMTGSFGTLGVIAEVNFRLHPVEEHARTWTVTASDGTADAAIFAEPLYALLNSQMTPSSVQVRASKQACALDIRIAAVPACLDEYAAQIRGIFSPLAVAESDSEVWKAREQLFEPTDSVVLKISALPHEVCSICAELQQSADGAIVAQANGMMMMAFRGAPDDAPASIERLRARISRSAGSVVVLRVPKALRGKVDVWGPGTNVLPLMQEIKRRFDPSHVLNPGRFLGSI